MLMTWLMVAIDETEDGLITKLNEWKDYVENRGMRINMNKTKVMISGEWQKAAGWPCGVYGRGVGNNSIQCAIWRCVAIVIVLWHPSPSLSLSLFSSLSSSSASVTTLR